MHAYVLLACLPPLLVAGSPVLVERAGGPAAIPIPVNCTIINPLPHAGCGTANVDGWMINPTFGNASLLYEAYFESSLSQAAQAKQCRQQCYGYGNLGDCKASFTGYNMPTPPGYEGTKGGALESGCLLFSEYMNPNTFIKAPAGQYVNATAANIYCPT